jgi:16S rRNA (guanine527-N7)-methyltransferase
MDEAAARASLDVSRETLERLEAFARLLNTENARQNLISKASEEAIWERHIADSAQLVRLAPPSAATWLDLGTGAGFPGLIASLLHPARVTLVESRKLRAQFLERAVEVLGIEGKTEVRGCRVEALERGPFSVISARAFAPLDRLLPLAERFSANDTVWVLPKGRNAKSELEAVRGTWQGEFRLERSLTDPEAGIIVARGVRRRGKGTGAR